MKRLLACLALCASLSASAQDDNCTVLGVQELTLAYQDLNASIDSITNALVALSDSLAIGFANAGQPQIIDYTAVSANSPSNLATSVVSLMSQGWVPFGAGGANHNGANYGARYWQAMVKYADD